jgi:hypothetical protein
MHVDNDPPLNNIIVSMLNGILYYIITLELSKD